MTKSSYSKQTNEFYHLAKEYCSYIDNILITFEKAEELLKILLELYLACLKLPDVDPDSINETPHTKTYPKVQIDFPDAYWLAFDPANKEVVFNCLSNDLMDIYMDLQEGIIEFDAGQYNNAVFEWRFGLAHHWGTHALNTVRLLHQIRTDGYFEAVLE